MVRNYIFLFILLVCLVLPVCALPTTQAATGISSNGATLNSAGGVAPIWFEYGQKSGSLTWKTSNSSNASQIVYGSPIIGNTLFYFRVCDGTGCGNELSFTTSALVPMAQTTYSAALNNMTASQFDIETIAGNSIAGYFWLTPTFPAIVWGLLFFGIYVGLWIRERDLVVPVILGLITGTFVMYGDAGLQLGIPVEFQAAAQGITYAALAGIILAWMKRS